MIDSTLTAGSDILTAKYQAIRLQTVNTDRRLRWLEGEKQRTVEESISARRSISVTALARDLEQVALRQVQGQ